MYQGLRGRELQSNCLSSESLKEEINNSLSLHVTLIPFTRMFILKLTCQALELSTCEQGETVQTFLDL